MRKASRPVNGMVDFLELHLDKASSINMKLVYPITSIVIELISKHAQSLEDTPTLWFRQPLVSARQRAPFALAKNDGRIGTPKKG